MMNTNLIEAAKALAQAHVDWHLARMCANRNNTHEDTLIMNNYWRLLLDAQDRMNDIAKSLALQTFSHN